jgi:hypothetical protein
MRFATHSSDERGESAMGRSPHSTVKALSSAWMSARRPSRPHHIASRPLYYTGGLF